MAAGDLLVLEHLGTAPCYTPACGYVKGMSTTGPADIIRIGRFTRLICQRCGANHGYRFPSLSIEETPK